MGYFIYKMYDKDNNLLYIGRTISISNRMSEHKAGREWWKDINKVYFASCKNETDMILQEIYLIAKLKPIYNKEYSSLTMSTFEIPNLIFFEYRVLKKNNIIKHFYHFDAMFETKVELRHIKIKKIIKAKHKNGNVFYKRSKRMQILKYSHNNKNRIYNITNKVMSYQEQRKENSYATKFIKLCKKLLNGEYKELLKKSNTEGVYSKKKIAKLLECNPKHASKLIYNNTDVIKFLEQHKIKIEGQSINFKQSLIKLN